MSRKREIKTVPAGYGRDTGKNFLIEESDARKAEKWAWRLFLVVKGTSAQVPEEIAPLGMIAVAIRGINSFLAADVDFAKLEPLLDEMIECVKIVRNMKVIDPVTGQPQGSTMISGDDIEEVQTLIWLRSEVVRIHTNFSLLDGVSSWVLSTMALMKKLEAQTSSST